MSQEPDIFKARLAEYVQQIRAFPADTDWRTILHYTIRFCEQHDLHEVFVACKFNPAAMFAFARYKSEDRPLSDLAKCIEVIYDPA